MMMKTSITVFLCLLSVTTYSAGISPDVSKVSYTCPSTEMSKLNSSATVRLTYSPEENETVNAIFPYSSQGNCTYEEVSDNATKVIDLNSTCFIKKEGGGYMAYVAVQYGKIFQYSDHLYGLVCQYPASQYVQQNLTIEEPMSWSPNISANITETVASGAAADEEFEINIIKVEDMTATPTVKLGDLVQIVITQKSRNIHNLGFYIESLEALDGMPGSSSATYNLSNGGCQTEDSLKDGVDGSTNFGHDYFNGTVKYSMSFSAFRFRTKPVVYFRALIVFCQSSSEQCTTPKSCPDVSHRRKREINILTGKPQDNIRGQLVTGILVYDDSDHPLKVKLPGISGQGEFGDIEGTSILNHGYIYIAFGILAMVLLVALIAMTVIIIRQRRCLGGVITHIDSKLSQY